MAFQLGRMVQDTRVLAVFSAWLDEWGRTIAPEGLRALWEALQSAATERASL